MLSLETFCKLNIYRCCGLRLSCGDEPSLDETDTNAAVLGAIQSEVHAYLSGSNIIKIAY